MSTITPKRLYQGQPATGITTLYTVPASTSAIVKEIILSNTTATDAKITLYVVASGGTAGVTNAIMVSKLIPANDIAVMALSTPMATGDFIAGSQVTASAITMTISGVQYA